MGFFDWLFRKKGEGNKPFEEWGNNFFINKKFSFFILLVAYFFVVFNVFLRMLDECMNPTPFIESNSHSLFECLKSAHFDNPLFLFVLFGLPFLVILLCFILYYIEKKTQVDYRTALILIIFGAITIGFDIYGLAIEKQSFSTIISFDLIMVGVIALIIFLVKRKQKVK